MRLRSLTISAAASLARAATRFLSSGLAAISAAMLRACSREMRFSCMAGHLGLAGPSPLDLFGRCARFGYGRIGLHQQRGSDGTAEGGSDETEQQIAAVLAVPPARTPAAPISLLLAATRPVSMMRAVRGLAGRAKVSMMIMRPPQQGHGLGSTARLVHRGFVAAPLPTPQSQLYLRRDRGSPAGGWYMGLRLHQRLAAMHCS
jgi:hypothetical protein